MDLSGPRKGWRYTGQLPGKAVLEADGILRSMEEDGDLEEVLNQCPDCSQTVNVSHLPPYSKIQCPHCGSSVRIRTMMGQYQITGVLGEGGMSQVFKAVDTHLQREVALKILHQALTQDKALTAMFEREAKLTASILHPNVVKVYTVGKEQGYFFIAMELVNAISLDQLIYNKGALSESEVLSIAHDVTSGLRAAHDQSLIHRDIKPGNMLVTEDGTAKLVDFGLAVQQGREDESEDLWATPFYVPPEKLEGEADTYLGDIYSLGATLFHALAGKPPFDANTSSLEELREIKKADLDLKGEA
ncbi:MAG: serine/threonine-protein kinase, partial [Verrucomicrobiota bacterium]